MQNITLNEFINKNDNQKKQQKKVTLSVGAGATNNNKDLSPETPVTPGEPKQARGWAKPTPVASGSLDEKSFPPLGTRTTTTSAVATGSNTTTQTGSGSNQNQPQSNSNTVKDGPDLRPSTSSVRSTSTEVKGPDGATVPRAAEATKADKGTVDDSDSKSDGKSAVAAKRTSAPRKQKVSRTKHSDGSVSRTKESGDRAKGGANEDSGEVGTLGKDDGRGQQWDIDFGDVQLPARGESKETGNTDSNSTNNDQEPSSRRRKKVAPNPQHDSRSGGSERQEVRNGTRKSRVQSSNKGSNSNSLPGTNDNAISQRARKGRVVFGNPKLVDFREFASVKRATAESSIYYLEGAERGLSFSELLRFLRDPKNKEVVLHKRQFDDSVPDQFEPGEHKLTAALAAQLLQSANIRTTAGYDYVTFPTLVDAPVELQEFIGVEYNGFTVADRFPDLGGDPKRVVTYLPDYKVGSYDSDIITMIDTIINDTDKDDPLKDQVLLAKSELLDTIDNHYFGNGSPDGQMGRLKKVLQVQSEVRAKMQQARSMYLDKKNKIHDVLREVVLESLKHIPLVDVDIVYDKNPSDMINTYEDDDMKMTHVEYSSDSGPVFGGLKRGEVFPQDLLMMDWIYAELTRGDVVDKFPWLFTAYLKPKSEVYTREEFRTKTRNVVAYNSCLNSLFQMLLRPFHKKMKNFMDDTNIWHYLGLSPYHYGFPNFLLKLINCYKEGGNIIPGVAAATYADNLTVVMDDFYYSYDGDKAEGTIDEEDIRNYMKHVCTGKEMNDIWLSIALDLLPMTATKSILIWANQQFSAGFMGSGIQGTAYFNTYKMITVLSWLKVLHRLHPNIKDKEKLMEMASACAGYKLKIESKVPLKAFSDLAPFIKTDLLGHDLIRLDTLMPGVDPTVYVPVLNFDRFKSSTAFAKNVFGQTNAPLPIVNAKKVFRYRALYVIGGFAYGAYGEVLRVLIERTLTREMQDVSNVRYDDQLERFLASLGVFDDADRAVYDQLMLVCQRRSIPTPFEMLELCFDSEMAYDLMKQFAQAHISNKKILSSLGVMMPMELVPQIAKDLKVVIEVPKTARLSRHVDDTRRIAYHQVSMREYLEWRLGKRDLSNVPFGPYAVVNWADYDKFVTAEKRAKPQTDIPKPDKKPGKNPLRNVYGSKEYFNSLDGEKKENEIKRVVKVVNALIDLAAKNRGMQFLVPDNTGLDMKPKQIFLMKIASIFGLNYYAFSKYATKRVDMDFAFSSKEDASRVPDQWIQYVEDILQNNVSGSKE